MARNPKKKVMEDRKTRKSIYVLNWVAKLLDVEGERYDGLSVTTAAAIHLFCSLSTAEQAKVLQNYREEEINRALGNEKKKT